MHEKHVTLETANAEERENFANEHPVNIHSEQSEKKKRVKEDSQGEICD